MILGTGLRLESPFQSRFLTMTAERETTPSSLPSQNYQQLGGTTIEWRKTTVPHNYFAHYTYMCHTFHV